MMQQRTIGTTHYERVTKIGAGHWQHDPFTDQVEALLTAARRMLAPGTPYASHVARIELERAVEAFEPLELGV